MSASAKSVTVQLAGAELRFETGRIARQADGAVVARHGDDVVLATVVGAREPSDRGFFPLTVEYREKLAAGGRIPGSFVRREGRITDAEILTSRLIDRTVRSLFPDGYRNEVQLQVTVLSAAPSSDPTSLALLAACAALHVSPIPANGPAAGLRVARVGESWVALPSRAQRASCTLDFVVSAGPDGLVMVEGAAREAGDGDVVEALETALGWTRKLHAAFADLAGAAGTRKPELAAAPPPPPLPDDAGAALRAALAVTGKAERHAAVGAARQEFLDRLPDQEREAGAAAFGAAHYGLVREAILADGRRLDGRDPRAIRPIWCEVGWLPRPHGSAIFTRGETQALVTCTLGTDDDAQRLEDVAGESRAHFLLHYNFPPYSVGEIRPLRGPGRREVGHGALARRGLEAVLPGFGDFPYTIRLESDISESNGSSSMATVCGGCLAMMHAGVPLARPVAGIAMGLVTDGPRTAVLSDILGDEDHLGDMDFKVVGTAEGITALQLDNKVGGLQLETLAAAIAQARAGLDHILAEMRKTLAEPAAELSRHAPRALTTAIPPDAIGALVGPRGVNIRAIQTETGSRITVDDDGRVRVYAGDGHAAAKALRRVGKSAGVVRAGGYYTATVLAVREFGVIVKINEITEGVVGKGELHDRSGRHERRELATGDEVVVRVTGVDDRGRLNLSIRAALDVDPALIEF